MASVLPGRLSKCLLKWQLTNVPDGFKKFNCNSWWQLCQIQQANKVATTTGKCARVTAQVHFQPKKAVVPEPKNTIDCNNHQQMCLSDWAISVATTTGKCAKVIEQKTLSGNNQTKQGQCAPQGRQQPLTIEMLLDLPGIEWSVAGTKRQKNFPFFSEEKPV